MAAGIFTENQSKLTVFNFRTQYALLFIFKHRLVSAFIVDDIVGLAVHVALGEQSAVAARCGADVKMELHSFLQAKSEMEQCLQ